MFVGQTTMGDIEIPSKRLHFRSLANALSNVQSSLMYVMDSLQRWDDNEWYLVEDTVARELFTITMTLGGVMDGLVILELPTLAPPPATDMSFERTPFIDDGLRTLQDSAKQLRSAFSTSQAKSADFRSLVNFWKYYLPYKPLPSVFERGVRDFKLALGGGDFSGPIMYDLILPTYNKVCAMMHMFSPWLNQPFSLGDLPTGSAGRAEPWASPPGKVEQDSGASTAREWGGINPHT